MACHLAQCGMDKHHDFLSEVERFCALRGISPESLCRKATGNPRKWDRLKGKFDALEADIARIRDEMAERGGTPPEVAFPDRGRE